jgi:hypothetical protein
MLSVENTLIMRRAPTIKQVFNLNQSKKNQLKLFSDGVLTCSLSKTGCRTKCKGSFKSLKISKRYKTISKAKKTRMLRK